MEPRTNIQKLAAKSFSLSLVLFGFGINLPDYLIPWFAAFVVITWLADILVNRKRSWRLRIRDNYALYFLILFALWSGLSFLISPTHVLHFKHVETRLMMLVFPVIFLFSREPQSRENTSILRAFIYGNFVSMAWVVFFIFRGLSESSINRVNFQYYPVEQIQYYIGLFRHRSYFDLNLIAGMIILYRFISKNNIIQLFYFIFYSLIVVSVVFISGARMPLIIASIVTVFIILRFFFGRTKSIIATGIFTLLVALWLPLSQSGNESSSVSAIQRKIEIRKELWIKSWQLIKEKPLTGYGPGDANIVHNTEGMPQVHNSHNQYLDILLESGVAGLALFLIAIWFLFLTARKSRYSGEAMLLLIFLISLALESMLDRIAGAGLFIFIVLIIRKHALYYNDTRHDLPARKLVPVSFFVLAVMIAGVATAFLAGKRFDPMDPASYGSRVHRVVLYNDLPGKVPEEIPSGAGGYYLDSTSNASVMDGNACSHTLFAEITANRKTPTAASVYCYVSDDFNGSYPQIACECAAENKVIYDAYNLEEKGTWQKLTIQPSCRKGKKQFYLWFELEDANDFSNLRGYIIFVYPVTVRHLKGV